MNQDFIDPEILSDFFIEAKEHLETIEPNLLELENNPENLGLLNEIFRPMHSLKGASGFLGLNKINGLAHKAENILDELRQGTIPVNSEIMDTILSATDALRAMVESLEETGSEGDTDTAPLITSIEHLLASGGKSAPAATQPDPVEDAAPSSAAPAQTAPAAEEPVAESVPEQPAEEPAAAEQSGQADLFVPIANPDFDETPYQLTTVGEGHLSDFLEEAQDIINNLNESLLELEGQKEDGGELINDTFRYFHNLKGNSGIIGFKELNSLTHEAETLLNKVRQGGMEVSQPLIDLLLLVVDNIEAMVARVEVESGQVTPMDASVLTQVLSKACEDGEVPHWEGSERMNGNGTQANEETPQEDEPEAPEEPVEAVAEEPQETAGSADSGYDPEDVAIFETTILQQLGNMEVAMDRLTANPDQPEYVDGLFRTLQTIQNSTGYMGLEELRDYAARTGGLVAQARDSDMDFSLMLDILRQELAIVSDMLKDALKDITGKEPEAEPAKGDEPAQDTQQAEEAPAPPEPEPAPEPKPEPAPAPKPETKEEQKAQPKPEAKAQSKPKPKPAKAAGGASGNAAPPPKAKAAATIRVDHHKLDHLMNLIGELIINRGRYTMLARALEEGMDDVQEVAQQLTETTYALSRISDDLQDTIMKVRMVPVSTVFSRFPRLVRDLSRKSGKQVELILEGEETELDKSVVEEIGDPLVHLIRNSMDHGLETNEERAQTTKSPKGHVWLRAYYKGNSVAIEVEDDGRGIDPDKMREVAVSKGVITPEEAKALDDREAVELIFHPGFSSAEKITDVSGRGVGMDVVKNNIKNLKGNVHTSSEVGRGTKFTLTLPLTLAIIDALMVQVAGDTFAIPLDAVSETTKIEAERLTDVNNRKAVTMRGEVLGIMELAEMLELPLNEDEREILPIVVIHDNERRLGLVVDRLLERQEIVIKPLGQFLENYDLRGVSGATIMGDGSVVLILDPHEIYSMATALTKNVP